MTQNLVTGEATLWFPTKETTDDALDILRQTLRNLKETSSDLEKQSPVVSIVKGISGRDGQE